MKHLSLLSRSIYILPRCCNSKLPSLQFLSQSRQIPSKRAYIADSLNMADRTTLVRPPPLDSSKSSMENLLELKDLSIIEPNLFTNTRPLWHPPGARGIYGGAVIAQCLAAAQLTVPADFTVHSMHCYFVLAGDSEIPVMYYVENVRQGKSYATRTVQARQRGRPIFTTTMSFVRENSGGVETVKHAVPLPEDVRPPTECYDETTPLSEREGASPFVSHRVEILNREGAPHEKKTRQWIRARGKISQAGGHQAHINALAYMSDSYFIGTVSRIHDLWRFGSSEGKDKGSFDEEMKTRERHMNKVKIAEGYGDDLDNEKKRPEVGMMVSLDHTIYFHEPRRFRADEWMFTEMWSPWSGEGRGVVTQHMYASDGTLVATCHQEGVVRLKQSKSPSSKL